MSVRSDSAYYLFLADCLSFVEGRYWRPATAHLALMGSLMIVVLDPGVKVFLQFFNATVDLLAKGNLVELLQYRLVETLADAIGLR